MTKLTPDKIGQCATWLSIVSQLYSTRMDVLLKPYGMTLSQFGVLNHLMRMDAENGHRVSDIARAVEVGQPAVTKMVMKFENMGLVQLIDDGQDKRVRRVRIRPKAHILVAEIRQSMGPNLFGAFDAIDDDKFEAFTDGLMQLGRWLDQNRLD